MDVGGHGGVGKAGAYSVDADVVGSVLDGGGFGEDAGGTFGCVVRGTGSRSDDAEDGGDVDD